MCVGWYHSHPGFGCWLSMTDMQTQKSFEQIGARSIALVIDPVQSVAGKLVIDCFRNIPMQDIAFNRDPRISTANTYWTKAKPNREA